MLFIKACCKIRMDAYIDGKEVISGNLIPLLRGRDVVSSPVTVDIQKESKQEPRTFTLHRADIRHKSSFAT